jgi:hypothetical protein
LKLHGHYFCMIQETEFHEPCYNACVLRRRKFRETCLWTRLNIISLSEDKNATETLKSHFRVQAGRVLNTEFEITSLFLFILPRQTAVTVYQLSRILFSVMFS